ncbi:Macrolide export ATP-binding/permease protein macB [uncultured Desulfobacterium sp.]|uniref:Macrolide export ATP-binding/permease protein macB n=1 Tax=uncultured Desulfobacterium sp. TaxID=201089 RepID=A0A445MVN4_9BACT|nr:Macrolide export ATP-binding/permease protein macB [uncultured Desulfobacterium sp.]
MKAYRTINTALQALGRNPMRATLTALGIIIGVAAVIAMMEIGKGSSAAIERAISSMGANNLLIHPGTAASGGVSFGGGTATTLTPQDCEAILQECPAVRSAAPDVQARTQVIYGNRNWVPLSINGSTPAYLDVRSWTDMAEGEMFTDRDVRNTSKVCVVGQTIVRELFSGASPIDKKLRIQNVLFRVVGVLSSKGANMMGADQDDIILAPWTTIKYRVMGTSLTNVNQSSSSSGSSTSTEVNSLNRLYPTSSLNLYPVPSPTQMADTPQPVRFTNVDHILACAQSSDEIPLAIRQITELLRERHRIRPNEAEDFSIRNMTEMTKTLSSTSLLMTNLLLSVALISLIVGGVGIMNIMLVSVTERTREIGLRMAVGARSKDILMQFLVEAIVMCLAGGIIGILAGCGGSYLVTLLLRWPTETSLTAIVVSVMVSATVGISFGFYPAWKASKLDPIEALRYE